MIYRGYSLTPHKFGIEVKNAKTGDHCGFSDDMEQAKRVTDEIMEGRRTGKFAGEFISK